MSGWPQQQGQHQQQQQQNGLYQAMLDGSHPQNAFDPAMSQMYAANGTLNPHQFNNPQYAQRMANGQASALQNQSYNVGQVIPSKRSRDEGAMGVSPAMQHTTLGQSRSHTPMQPGTPFTGQPGQQYPSHYQHLQQGGSANASPSPTMSHQQFRQPQPPQRMTTQSPAQFNQMPQNSSQMSPTAQMPSANMMSPQAQQQSFSPTLGGGQGFGQPFQNSNMQQQALGAGMSHMPPNGMNMTPQMQAQLQQRQYQQQLLRQQRGMQANAAALGQRQASGQMNPQAAAQMSQGFLGQSQLQQQQQQSAAAMTSQQLQQQQQQQQHHMPHLQQQTQGQMQAQPNLQALQHSQQEKAKIWLQTVHASLQAQGKPFNPNPVIAGRPVSLYMIWACIVAFGGSARITAGNAWDKVAAKLQLQGHPTAAQELQNVFEAYLSGFEKQAIARQAQRSAQINARQLLGGQQPQPSPTRQGGPQETQSQQQMGGQIAHSGLPQNQLHAPQQQVQSLPRGLNQLQNGSANINAAATPTMEQIRRQSMLNKIDPSAAQQEFGLNSPMKSLQRTPSIKKEDATLEKPVPEQEKEYLISRRLTGTTYGGYDVQALFDCGTEISIQAQDSIRAQTMFNVDIKTLTMCVESGIRSEVRYALDTLLDLSCKTIYWKDTHSRQTVPGMLSLDRCEDLYDALLDSFEQHLNDLGERIVSGETSTRFLAYEELVRRARAENDTLQEDPEPGTEAYDKLHLANRVVALLQLFANLSMEHNNQPQFATAQVVSLISDLLHFMGTQDDLLVSHENTLEAYKHLVTLLSNCTGAKFELKSQEDARRFLLFLLAFAPTPHARINATTAIDFIPYNPAVHRYLPSAVDSFAKLLARQEPNRAFLRSILIVDAPHGADEARSLFTQAFAMCVSFLPDRTKGPVLIDSEWTNLKLRKAYLSQGMLAADILASLIPAPSTSTSGKSINLAKVLLEADSAWPGALLRAAFLLSTSPKVNENLLDPAHRPVRRDMHGNVLRDRAHMPIFDESNDVPGIIANRGLSMLHRLIQKAITASESSKARSRTDFAAVRANGSGKAAPAEADVSKQDVPGAPDDAIPETNGEVLGAEDDELFVLGIKGDPIPTRETITALLGAPHPVETEALRTMDKIYELFMPRM